MLATDRAVRRLNARDRGRNKPTNVLTYDPPAPGLPGEIILALGTDPARGAPPAGAARRIIWRIWWCMARCTWPGHDHHHAGEARRMEMAEARILHRLRRAEPVEARHERRLSRRACWRRLRALLLGGAAGTQRARTHRRTGAGGRRRAADPRRWHRNSTGRSAR